MKEIQVIETALSQAATRRRWDRALRGFWHGLLAGSIVWLLGLLLYKLLPIPLSSLAIAGATGALLPLAGWIIGGWRRPTLLETARWVDAKRNLKERLSTALE